MAQDSAVTHQDFVHLQQSKAAATAAAVLAHTEGAILGARTIIALLQSADVDSADPDLLALVALDSETDALPVGPEIAHWSEDALSRLSPELADAERYARTTYCSHFQNIVKRFGPSNQPLHHDASGGLTAAVVAGERRR